MINFIFTNRQSMRHFLKIIHLIFPTRKLFSLTEILQNFVEVFIWLL